MTLSQWTKLKLNLLKKWFFLFCFCQTTSAFIVLKSTEWRLSKGLRFCACNGSKNIVNDCCAWLREGILNIRNVKVFVSRVVVSLRIYGLKRVSSENYEPCPVVALAQFSLTYGEQQKVTLTMRQCWKSRGTRITAESWSGKISQKFVKSTCPINSLKVDVFLPKSNTRF